jgi:hypothetical protein
MVTHIDSTPTQLATIAPSFIGESQKRDLAEETEEMLWRSASRHRQENLFMEKNIANLEGQRAKNGKTRERWRRSKEREREEKASSRFTGSGNESKFSILSDGQARDKGQAARPSRGVKP